jgi:CheY-like chemotaxis protein
MKTNPPQAGARPEGAPGVSSPSPGERELVVPPRRSVTVQEAHACLSGLTGIVVDEDAETFCRIFVSLDHVGCRVRLARRFVQGVKMLREVRPSFVIVATRVEGGSAAELLRLIKAEPASRHTLVLALAASENRHERRRLLGNGFDGYLAKPVDLHLFAQELVAQVPAFAELRSPVRGNS